MKACNTSCHGLVPKTSLPPSRCSCLDRSLGLLPALLYVPQSRLRRGAVQPPAPPAPPKCQGLALVALSHHSYVFLSTTVHEARLRDSRPRSRSHLALSSVGLMRSVFQLWVDFLSTSASRATHHVNSTLQWWWIIYLHADGRDTVGGSCRGRRFVSAWAWELTKPRLLEGCPIAPT
jgi:hypothetical protein